MFKDALAQRRCLVPTDAFYEWEVVEGHAEARAAMGKRNAGPAVLD